MSNIYEVKVPFDLRFLHEAAPEELKKALEDILFDSFNDGRDNFFVEMLTHAFHNIVDNALYRVACMRSEKEAGRGNDQATAEARYTAKMREYDRLKKSFLVNLNTNDHPHIDIAEIKR